MMGHLVREAEWSLGGRQSQDWQLVQGDFNMAQRADPKQTASLEEVLRSILYEQEALRRVLVRKGLVKNEEVLDEIKAVRRELDGKGAR